MEKLLKYLEGKNKSEFARRLGFKHAQNFFALLPRRDGRPPVKGIGVKTARRIVAATGGEVTFEDLLGAQPARKAA